MSLSEVDQARFDNIARQCSGISRELADPITRNLMIAQMQPQIAAIKELYDAYPEDVQAVVRRELMPRLDFTWDTDMEPCSNCIRGMVSPDREEFAPVLDANGNKTYKEVKVPVIGPDGAPMLDADNQPVLETKVVLNQKPIAIEKERCPVCKGVGEVKRAE